MSEKVRAALFAAATLIALLAASPRAAHAICGDGILETDSDEECDDGNLLGGDGCSISCRVRLCLVPPPPDCLVAGTGSLRIKQQGKDDKITATLKLTLGDFAEAVALADFGDPIFSTTRYDFCYYDEEVRLATQMFVSRGFATCGKKKRACWRALGDDGYRFVDRELTASGIAKLDLVAGAPGVGRLALTGKRTKKVQALPLMTEAFANDAAIRVMVMSDDGRCLTVSLDDVEVTPTSLRARTAE